MRAYSRMITCGSRDAVTKTSSGSAGRGGRELPVRAGEVERAQRLMDEHPPAVGAHEPLDRHAAAMRAELIAALAVAHAVGLTLAIELRPALAEAEERTLRQQERHVRRLRVERQPLDGPAGRRLDVERGRLRREAHGQVPRAHGLECVCRPPRTDALCRVRLHQCAIVGHCRRRPCDEWEDADADRSRTER